MYKRYGRRTHSLSVTKWLCGHRNCVSLLFLAVYALKNGKKYLYQHIKSFFRHKERAGLFDDTSNFNIRYTLSLGSISCISAGLFVYDFFSKTDPFLFQIVSHYAILFIYIFCVLLTVTGKALLYQFINWIFFDKEKIKPGFLPILICSPVFPLSYFLCHCSSFISI